jgi:hypothetical protein
MKTLGVIGFLLVVMCGCTSQKDIVRIGQANRIVGQDTTQYELIIFDPTFDTWYLTNFSPAKDHTNEYYQSWNNQYVSDWNYHYMAGYMPTVFENYIDYDYSLDYGINLNRELYYYFRYVETYLKVPILLVGRKNTT